jgi:uncharacterized C2H2 Zn-finger protein
MQPKYVPPSVNETAFNCPHCGALAKQTWYTLKADTKDGKNTLPQRLTHETVDRTPLESVKDPDERAKLEKWLERMIAGAPFMQVRENGYFGHWQLYNADLSRCYNCDDIAIWIGSALVWPVRGEAPQPNPDLPADVRLDYEEAGRILQLSPRGAAALLRLAIQKLCKELGEKGRNIDDDIASLVKKGLDVRIQRALDIVRVIGNESVHPGQIDMRDNIGTAEKLFALVNLVADAMISQPKHIAEMYGGLPEAKREAIEKRDGRALLAAPRQEGDSDAG